MEGLTLLYIIGALIAAIGITYFQYWYKQKEKSSILFGLSFLRCLSLFLLLLLLINPSVKKQNLEEFKPELIVSVDNSKSMKNKGLEALVLGQIELIEQHQELNEKFDIRYFKFGNSLDVLDSLNFDQNESNVSLIFEGMSKMYPKRNPPVILITDGNQTSGRPVEFVNYQGETYPVVLGDTTIVEDTSISRINLNKYTFINNRLPVELFVQYNGSDAINRNLNVYNEEKLVYSEKVALSGTEPVKIVSFYLQPSEKGMQYYSARLDPLDNEPNILNNQKNFNIEVIEEKSEILLISSILHPDLGMLKKAIEANKLREVTILQPSALNVNLSDYQLLILYQPDDQFSEVFEIVNEQQLNFLLISGTSTDWQFLNEHQNYVRKQIVNDTENVQSSFNPNYPSFLIEDIGFSNFPPIQDVFGKVLFSQLQQHILYQKIGLVETKDPLLTTFENKSQKGAFLFGENSWRWRMYCFQEFQSFEQFDNFISKVVQYLSSNIQGKRLNVSVEPVYYSNQLIQVTANYLDANLQFDERAKLRIQLREENTNKTLEIPFSLVNGRYYTELSNMESGDWEYRVLVENQTEQVSGRLKIIPFDVEQQFSSSNDKALLQIAGKTKGFLSYNSLPKTVLDQLATNPEHQIIQVQKQVSTPIIDWYWLLGAIIFLLSIEWFARKYYGKI